MLDHKYLEGDPEAPVLLLLHGTGGAPGDLLGLGRDLSPSSALLAPAGPVSEHGAARWFRRLAEGVFDHEDVVARANQLADFVLTARKRYDLDGRRLVAVGFSNGANIAAAVTLLRPDAIREAVLFAAMFPLAENTPIPDLTGTRVFASNGEHDPMAPLPSAERLTALLRRQGVEVTTYRHGGGHLITPEAEVAAKDWLTTG
ncbi:alpha/beta hydrolase [Amycolatopsis cynarae]|uniref:Alpha/beta hydrolase n=1 Tax=Amycolatopsis cynarae TaxID=2995223 RepID=A0ABY7B2M9_9PSEU|nr:alpha/beta hydrolase [Amycolatopsis sp. HUAS 11-8]WAL66207.1 alpha/beta hydrolase [Amycolatopsis sp. HUAS 11-8]